MKVNFEQDINDCDDCIFYTYIRCYGYDCENPNAPDEKNRGNEPLAENREVSFPKWCPFIEGDSIDRM